MISGILFALTFTNSSDYHYTAKNKKEPVQQDITISPDTTKEKPPASNYYQGILLTREGLKGYLKEIFIYNGLEDQIEQGLYTIENESSWIWDNSNGISAGLAAFTRETWSDICKGYGNYDDLNPHSQIRCLAAAWARGEQGRWDAWCLKYGYGNWRCQKRGLYPKY